MSSIKCNCLTKEIEMEMKGSESFIESNFDKIEDLIIESFGVKRNMISRITKANQEPVSVVIMKESQKAADVIGHELSTTSTLAPTTISTITEISHEFRANRPPLRKYIRKVGAPGHERTVVEIVEQKPKEITLASLREKFGLSDSKIGGIIRDAEKLGKPRRVMNGSYAWAQE
jgi:hypothetical protein